MWRRLLQGYTQKAWSKPYTVDVVCVRTGRQFDNARVFKGTVSSTSTLDCILFCEGRKQSCYSLQDLFLEPANMA